MYDPSTAVASKSQVVSAFPVQSVPVGSNLSQWFALSCAICACYAAAGSWGLRFAIAEGKTSLRSFALRPVKASSERFRKWGRCRRLRLSWAQLHWVPLDPGWPNRAPGAGCLWSRVRWHRASAAWSVKASVEPISCLAASRSNPATPCKAGCPQCIEQCYYRQRFGEGELHCTCDAHCGNAATSDGPTDQERLSSRERNCSRPRRFADLDEAAFGVCGCCNNRNFCAQELSQ